MLRLLGSKSTFFHQWKLTCMLLVKPEVTIVCVVVCRLFCLNFVFQIFYMIWYLLCSFKMRNDRSSWSFYKGPWHPVTFYDRTSQHGEFNPLWNCLALPKPCISNNLSLRKIFPLDFVGEDYGREYPSPWFWVEWLSFPLPLDIFFHIVKIVIFCVCWILSPFSTTFLYSTRHNFFLN